MDNRILQELKDIERKQGVEILYAVEAGSRAWGFPSPESDYDIRFIYKHSLDWYLSLDKKRDVIEKQIGEELELSGWDIKKAMSLLKKSNPSLLEWLHTEDKIIADKLFCQQVLPIQDQLFSAASCYYHYLKMSKSNWIRWKKDEEKKTKLTIHLLRGMLCCIWIRDHQRFPPIKFQTLYEQTIKDHKICEEAARLAALKKAGEKTLAGSLKWLGIFINNEMERLLEEAPGFHKNLSIPTETVEEVFRSIVKRKETL
jgi:uncharacterized protein